MLFEIEPLKNNMLSKKFPKAELLQLNRTQFSSLGIFVGKEVKNPKNWDQPVYNF